MAENKKPRSNKPIKSWFITFPQSGEYTLAQFRELFEIWPVQYYKIVKELHEDGKPHIHMILQFKGTRTFSALLGRIKEKLPYDWKRIKLETLKSRDDAEIYLSKDCKEKIEGGQYVVREKKVKPIPSWIRECKEERETQYDRDISIARYRMAEAEYEMNRRFVQHMLIKGELDMVYPVWARRLEYAYGDPRLWCREKIFKKK